MFRLTYKVSTLVFDPETKTFLFDDTECAQAVDVSVLPLFGDADDQESHGRVREEFAPAWLA